MMCFIFAIAYLGLQNDAFFVASMAIKSNTFDENVSSVFQVYEPFNGSSVDPIEASGKFEGDILLPAIQEHNALKDRSLIWPEGVVPFELEPSFSVRGRLMLFFAVTEISRNTCVRFVPRRNETNYLYVFRGDGCWSMVGLMQGRQPLSLANPCQQMGIIIHEFMHALGFWHEQSRMDRDDYITIRWENIVPGTEGNFQKYGPSVQQLLDEEYDYTSLMHYSGRAFSKNSFPTIVPKRIDGLFTIGQRLTMSAADIRKINKLYGCETENNTTTSENV